jgi:hypothetical protein
MMVLTLANKCRSHRYEKRVACARAGSQNGMVQLNAMENDLKNR